MCNDGRLNIFVTTILAIFLSPLLLFQCCRAKCARKKLPGQRSNTCYQLCACCGPAKTDYSNVVRDYCIRTVGEAAHERNKVTFVCLSDTHNRHRSLCSPLPLADVLVHTGDFTNFGTYKEVRDFVQWFGNQPHPVKIVVPGNHDMIIDQQYWQEYWSDWSDVHEQGDDEKAIALFAEHGIHLLIDQRLDIPVPVVQPFLPIRNPVHDTDDGNKKDTAGDNYLSVYGSPWVTKYAQWSTAFNRVPDEMKKHWNTVTNEIQSHERSGGNVDVLLTHMPPKSVGDMEPNGTSHGCEYLRAMVEKLSPTVHVFGHVHSDAGWGNIAGTGDAAGNETQCLNAASVCDYYFIRKNPVTFEVSTTTGTRSLTKKKRK